MSWEFGALRSQFLELLESNLDPLVKLLQSVPLLKPLLHTAPHAEVKWRVIDSFALHLVDDAGMEVALHLVLLILLAIV